MSGEAQKPRGSEDGVIENAKSSPADRIAAWRWKPGTVPNPAGRPKGSRNKLGEAFLSDLLESWEVNGKAAIARAIKESPIDYVKIVAATLPKEFVIDRPSDGLTDDQLGQFLDFVRSRLAQAGSGEAGGGTLIEGGAIEVVPLPALSETEGIPQERLDASRAPADGGEPTRQDDRRVDGSGDACDGPLPR